MDRRYSSSSSPTATETAKKAAVGNALNSSIRFRNANNSNGLSTSTSDSTVSPSYRKSFPSTSDVGSSFNSTNQVITLNISFPFPFLTFDISPSGKNFTCHLRLEINNISDRVYFYCFVELKFHQVDVPVGIDQATPSRCLTTVSSSGLNETFQLDGLTGTLLK